MTKSDDESYYDGDGRGNRDENSVLYDGTDHGNDGSVSESKSADDTMHGSSKAPSEAENTEFQPSSRTKRRRKKLYDPEAPEDILPSFARKTNRGGYAHTNRTKSKISQANTGNTPWNKGQNRSSADRAKIAAGVRARNRAILLEKLKRLGLSEEEWYAKKKEIKYLRERVRRAKLSAKRQEQAEAERNLQAVIDATTEKSSGNSKARVGAISKRHRVQKMEETVASANQSFTEPVLEPATDEGTPGAQATACDSEEIESDIDEAGEIFAKEVDFRPYSFGPNGESYDQACPTGGPGGFICCEECAKKYSWYLSNTVKDMEMHRTNRNGREVQELLKFLQQGRRTLDNAYTIAQKKIPPLPKIPVGGGRGSGGTSTAYKGMPLAGSSEPKQWNITSSVDVGMTNNASNVEWV